MERDSGFGTPDSHRFPIGTRGAVLLGIVLSGVWAFLALDLGAGDVFPTWADLGSMGRFFGRAFTPALDYEATFVPQGAPPLWLKALDGAHRTVTFAAMAMSASILIGLPLGFLASSAWWIGDPMQRGGGCLLAGARLKTYLFARFVIVLMRSIHELIWAVLFLAAMGFTNEAAIVAIAIPYGGTLAKVFSEILDEAPQDTADALRGAGASSVQVFCFGLLPRALPDMAAYTFYRFECAMRSSAILGFFGLETLGKFIRESWEEQYFGEVWTYLYTLFALVLVMEWWSGALRRRVVA